MEVPQALRTWFVGIFMAFNGLWTWWFLTQRP